MITIPDIENVVALIILLIFFFVGISRKQEMGELSDRSWAFLTIEKNLSVGIKGIACVFVLMGHYGTWLFESGADCGIITTMVTHTTANIALAWFMFFSGYGLSLKPYKDGKIRGIWLNRIKKLYLPLFFVCVCSALLYLLLPKSAVGTISSWYDNMHNLSNINSLDVLYQTFGLSDWYVVCIIYFVSLFYLAVYVEKKTGYNLSIILGALLLIYIGLAFWIYGPPQAHYYRYPWAFMLGHLVAAHNRNSSKVNKHLLIVFLLTWVLLDKFSIASYIIAILLLFIFGYINNRFEYKGKMMLFVGGFSYFFYLSHMRLSWPLVMLSGIEYKSMIIWIIVTILCSIVLQKVYNYILNRFEVRKVQMMRSLLCFVSLLVIVSCSNEDNWGEIINPSEDINSYRYIKLVTREGIEYEPFQVNDSIIHISVGTKDDIKSLRLKLGSEYNRNTVLIDGQKCLGDTVLDFSDFLNPHRIAVINTDETSHERLIQIYNIPVLTLDTPNGGPITSKTEKIKGCLIKMYEGVGGAKFEGTASVEGRGNSTWVLPKKPYNIKLDKKYGFFGLPESKQWILLANAYWDRTQMHNAIAYEMARLTDYSWVQSGQFVELIFNGTHHGLYYLCEKIRVEKGRININIMDPTAVQKENMDGGYFIETAFSAEKNTFQTDCFNKTDAGTPLFWEIKEPDEELLASQAEYIKENLNHLEKLISNEDSVKVGRYRDYLDIESAINWMLVNEVACNQETLNPSNLFLYRDKGGLLSFGPPWDFDAHTFGVYGEHKVFLQRPTFYFYWMMKDPVFVERLKEKWTLYKTKWLEEIPSYIDQLYSQLYPSALRNELIWPDWYWMYYYPDKDYTTLIEEMKSFFYKQVDYVDGVIEKMTPGS